MVETIEKIKAKINGIDVEVAKGTSILDAADAIHIKIPTLCKHKDVVASAACGICIVKVKGGNKMLRACCTALEEGMDIITHDPEIINVRRTVVELILSNHPDDCLICGRNGNCELQEISEEFGIRDAAFKKVVQKVPRDDSTGAIMFEPAKCIKCGRCVEVCQNQQNVWALGFMERGIDTRIASAGDIDLNESPCVKCGQCSAHCPTGAIFEHDETQAVWDHILDEKKHCVIQIAPAVRVAAGEYFGMEPGTNVTGKLYAAFRRMGFDAVFDTNFGADLTILEEGSEFVERFANGKGDIPLITSCCPAWVDFMEKYYPEIIGNFSSCKSPHQMVGALTKTYYAEKNNIDPKDIFVVSIMPCTAKKFEVARSKDMESSGFQDVDVSLTTRELCRMIKQGGIEFDELEDEQPDHLMGDYTGAGTIFGATGGVMEAAIRSAYYLITKEELGDVDVKAVRGLDGIKEAEIDVKGTKVKVAVAHGLGNVETVVKKIIKAKEEGSEPPYHFVEVMACPGGCIAGGGQPYGVNDEIRKKRSSGMYQDDVKQKQRCSHQNPFITKLYEEFLEKPLSEKSHKLLHTHYTERKQYKK